MADMDEERGRLTGRLSEQYARNVISVEEYERVLEYINKIETGREAAVIEKIILENEGPLAVRPAGGAVDRRRGEAGRRLSVFSWRSSHVTAPGGDGGEFAAVFGAHRIIVDNLPPGRTTLKVGAVFGLVELVVSKNIRVVNRTVPVFAGIFAPPEVNREGENLPELYIEGAAVFGNITIRIV